MLGDLDEAILERTGMLMWPSSAAQSSVRAGPRGEPLNLLGTD